MFFLNLSALEFLGLFSVISGVVVTLYLLSRARKKQVVPTLRFWIQAQQPAENKQRRRIQQPLSLILQLLGLALLLLAIAQLRLGNPENSSRDHVLLLDTSSWTAASRAVRSRNLLDEAKAKAHAYMRSLPSTDRVMIVRADAVASPVTGMESNRTAIAKAIDDSRPGASALNLDQAFSFAGQARRLHARNPGEVIFIGANRITNKGVPAQTPANLRVIPIEGPRENVGLTKIGLRRGSSDPEIWNALVSVQNYGPAPRRVPVILMFGGAPAGSRMVDLPAGKSADVNFEFRTRVAGWVEARLLATDRLVEDNRALLEIPALQALKVIVYTDQPQLLRPALAAHAQIQATFRRPAEYTPKADAPVVVLDRFVPQEPPQAASVWIHPPAGKSPIAVRTSVANVPVVHWRTDHDIGSGLHTRQLRLASSAVFAVAPGDVSVAEVEAGPVIVARPKSKMIALGFHPGDETLRYDLATPLLIANMLRWVSPEVFRSSETYGRPVGAVSVVLGGAAESSNIRVLGETRELPFSVQDRTLRFFSGVPDRVRIITDAGEQVHSLSMPELGTALWEPPASARRGLPGRFEAVFSRDIWQILALVGAIILVVEWVMFGRSSRRKVSARTAEPGPTTPLRRAS